jgi:hypothetical protein
VVAQVRELLAMVVEALVAYLAIHGDIANGAQREAPSRGSRFLERSGFWRSRLQLFGCCCEGSVCQSRC